MFSRTARQGAGMSRCTPDPVHSRATGPAPLVREGTERNRMYGTHPATLNVGKGADSTAATHHARRDRLLLCSARRPSPWMSAYSTATRPLLWAESRRATTPSGRPGGPTPAEQGWPLQRGKRHKLSALPAGVSFAVAPLGAQRARPGRQAHGRALSPRRGAHLISPSVPVKQ